MKSTGKCIKIHSQSSKKGRILCNISANNCNEALSHLPDTFRTLLKAELEHQSIDLSKISYQQDILLCGMVDLLKILQQTNTVFSKTLNISTSTITLPIFNPLGLNAHIATNYSDKDGNNLYIYEVFHLSTYKNTKNTVYFDKSKYSIRPTLIFNVPYKRSIPLHAAFNEAAEAMPLFRVLCKSLFQDPNRMQSFKDEYPFTKFGFGITMSISGISNAICKQIFNRNLREIIYDSSPTKIQNESLLDFCLQRMIYLNIFNLICEKTTQSIFDIFYSDKLNQIVAPLLSCENRNIDDHSLLYGATPRYTLAIQEKGLGNSNRYNKNNPYFSNKTKKVLGLSYQLKTDQKYFSYIIFNEN